MKEGGGGTNSPLCIRPQVTATKSITTCNIQQQYNKSKVMVYERGLLYDGLGMRGARYERGLI